MKNIFEDKLQLLSPEEFSKKLQRVCGKMREQGLDALLINDNANLFYLTGRIFFGYILILADGCVKYFIRRPLHLDGEEIIYIRKPEDITPTINQLLGKSSSIGFMGDDISWGLSERLRAVFDGRKTVNASNLLRQARSVKTSDELLKMEISGRLQTEVYKCIPGMFKEGMSDIELQIEIERALRLKGCLGIFRTSGDDLELFMGNVLTGENADSPSPYDFAMGGRGIDPSLPVGADGTIIKTSMPVMVDMNGNFNGYMTDMTRCYIAGNIHPIVEKAHKTSCEICSAISEAACPGVTTKSLYDLAVEIATKAGLADNFMGHRQHAGFVGHGVGITVNEPPVLAPRSRDILEAGHTIAVEPKFVIPGYGAIGIENTYVIEPIGKARCITNCPEDIMNLI